ncbi:DUF5908 family protein [Paraburkholderia aspalathi]|uniref:DUF5908 family protein n=1 Tax=Paraburkholderia aspalathi TaxID=1324617 RepID=UPI0038BA2F07
MTVEIRELVIEARVVAGPTGSRHAVSPRGGAPTLDEARLIERIVQRVVQVLREQQREQV